MPANASNVKLPPSVVLLVPEGADKSAAGDSSVRASLHYKIAMNRDQAFLIVILNHRPNKLLYMIHIRLNSHIKIA